MKNIHWCYGISAMLLVCAFGFSSVEEVQLKNGKYLIGKVLYDEKDPNGFWLERADNGGKLYIRWEQLHEAEQKRLQRLLQPRSTEVERSSDFIMGLRIVTPYRVIDGVLLSEKDGILVLKTLGGNAYIPINAILKRSEIRLRPTDVYLPKELLDQRAKETDMNDAGQLLKLVDYARSLKLYAEAQDYLLKAQKLAPNDETIQKLVPVVAKEVKESQAAALLKDILRLKQTQQYDKAIELAKNLSDKYPDTAAMTENPNLLQNLEKEQKEFEKNRLAVLTKRIHDEWRVILNNVLAQLAAEDSVGVPGQYIDEKIDDEIMRQLVQRLKLDQEEIKKIWKARGPDKKYSVTFKTGSWIILGGFDGGPDNDNANFAQNLQTRDEWWKSVSQADRKDWLEAYYAMNSSFVTLQEEKKNACMFCRGKGTATANRRDASQQDNLLRASDVPVQVVCPRCHGVKEDLTVKYY